MSLTIITVVIALISPLKNDICDNVVKVR